MQLFPQANIKIKEEYDSIEYETFFEYFKYTWLKTNDSNNAKFGFDLWSLLWKI